MKYTREPSIEKEEQQFQKSAKLEKKKTNNFVPLSMCKGS
jgi:hypothetical protein